MDIPIVVVGNFATGELDAVVSRAEPEGTGEKSLKVVNDLIAEAKLLIKQDSYYQHRDDAVYRIVGHSFDAERQRVMILYTKVDNFGADTGDVSAPFSHLIGDFLEEGRFTKVRLETEWKVAA